MLPTIAKWINGSTWKFKFCTQMWHADSCRQGCKSEAVNYKRKFYLSQRKMLLKFTLFCIFEHQRKLLTLLVTFHWADTTVNALIPGKLILIGIILQKVVKQQFYQVNELMLWKCFLINWFLFYSFILSLGSFIHSLFLPFVHFLEN